MFTHLLLAVQQNARTLQADCPGILLLSAIYELGTRGTALCAPLFSCVKKGQVQFLHCTVH